MAGGQEHPCLCAAPRCGPGARQVEDREDRRTAGPRRNCGQWEPSSPVFVSARREALSARVRTPLPTTGDGLGTADASARLLILDRCFGLVVGWQRVVGEAV